MNLLETPYCKARAYQLVPGDLILYEGRSWVVDEVRRSGETVKVLGNFGDGIEPNPSSRRASLLFYLDDPVRLVPGEKERAAIRDHVADAFATEDGALIMSVNGREYSVLFGVYFEELEGVDGATPEGGDAGPDASDPAL